MACCVREREPRRQWPSTFRTGTTDDCRCSDPGKCPRRATTRPHSVHRSSPQDQGFRAWSDVQMVSGLTPTVPLKAGRVPPLRETDSPAAHKLHFPDPISISVRSPSGSAALRPNGLPHGAQGRTPSTGRPCAQGTFARGGDSSGGRGPTILGNGAVSWLSQLTAAAAKECADLPNALLCGLLIEFLSSLEMQLRPPPYGAAFSHCFVHCLIMSECPCPEHVSILVGLIVEIYQSSALPFKSASAAQSAMQKSDFWDNALGRKLAKRNQRNPRDFCFGECLAETETPFVKEGPGTKRPYGPYHPTTPGPTPSLLDVLGLTLPSDWGPN